MSGPCPTVERLAAALRGPRREGDESELAVHLSECAACQAQLEALAGGSGWLQTKAKSHAPTESSASDSLTQAIAALESDAEASTPETTPPPKLDFLQSSDQPGVLGRFGPYELIAHVASGGMGIVLKARDPALNRLVALKILAPTLAANALSRARFVREARAAAAVIHENVVPIYAVDECAGLPYLVMQFVHGRSLSERIRLSGPLRLEEILRIGAQTAAGLAAAHAQGVIHRDVKPGNILLENSVERVKLTDFGLACAADDARLTRTGELAGTPEFMSPEQAKNEPVDHRADLFSLGSALYAMCTGRSPFHATSVVAAIRKVCDERPQPVHEVNPAIPRWLTNIIARLMSKSPTERFQSAREVGDLLERYLARVQHGELRELPGSRSLIAAHSLWRKLAYAAIVTLVVLGVLMFALHKRAEPKPISQSQPGPFAVFTEAGKSAGEFAKIDEAATAAPVGGVIELCWNGPRNIDPITLPSKPLTLRAGRGFQPVWSSSDSASALSASASLTLENIQFEIKARTRGDRSANLGPRRPRILPSGLAFFSITNGPLRIAHCTLEVGWGVAASYAGIVLNNIEVCRIEDTLLFIPGGKAIVWQQSPRGNDASSERTAQVTMTNCCAAAGEMCWLDLGKASRARFEIARCSFNGPFAFYVPPSLAAANLAVDARQNVFHTGTLIFDGRDAAAPPLREWFEWRDQENLQRPHRRPDQRLIAGVAFQDGPATLNDWNQWWNQTGTNSRQVELAFAGGASDMKAGLPVFFPQPDSFRIIDLRLFEGPPVAREEWSRFGADTASVGPRSVQ